MKAAASVPGKHVELFRKLQAKWQCYDAYARISMALGVNQMIPGVWLFFGGLPAFFRKEDAWKERNWKVALALECLVAFCQGMLGL